MTSSPTLDPTDVTPNDDKDLQDLPTFNCVVWVDGMARLTDNLVDSQVAMSQLRIAAAKIGLHTHIQQVDDPYSIVGRPRRRWATHRVPLETVMDLVETSPGIRMEDAVDRLYRTEAWTPYAQAQACGKMRVALSRLGPTRVHKAYDRDGTERLYPAGEVSEVRRQHTPILQLPAILPQDAVAQGANALKRRLHQFAHEGADVDSLIATDPTWIGDVVREIVGAVSKITSGIGT